MTAPAANTEEGAPVTFGTLDHDPRARRTRIGQVLAILGVLGILLFGISPSPYVIERPGPVYDTLGTVEIDDEEVRVIEISGAETFPTSGRLDLLTVYVSGSRENPVDWFSVVAAWLDPSKELLPVDLVFPEGQTEEESDAESALDMQLSQQEAIAAALTQLGIPFSAVVTVLDVADGTPAAGILEAGDEIVTVGGASVSSDAELRAAILEAGTGAPLEFVVNRDGAPLTLEVTPAARSEDDPSPFVGITPGMGYDFPLEVEIHLGEVGGPSAGMMFALGIYDTLTPGELVGGEHVAGTGTIQADGTVGAIGGIRQKMIGARDAGADWFLAPESNCDEVVGKIPDGLTVFAVSTLDQALEVVSAIGSGAATESFAGCTG